MSLRPGDPDKKPPECGEHPGGNGRCPHIKEVSGPSDFDGETYACEVCGERYRLYYEDMA